MSSVILLIFWFILCDGVTEVPGEHEVPEELLASQVNEQIFELNYSTNTSYHKTTNMFYCSADIKNTSLLLYGTKSWMFPKQDINLTLSYPSRNGDFDDYEVLDKKLITEFKVRVDMDGTELKGFVTGGGIMQGRISLTFIGSDTSRLSYQIWLYGKVFPSSYLPTTKEFRTYQKLCI